MGRRGAARQRLGPTFFFSSRRRHTRLVSDWVQTCALPICPVTALFWISMSIGGLSAASPVGWSIPSLIAPRESVGTLGGILNFCNQLAGVAAPIFTGYIEIGRASCRERV